MSAGSLFLCFFSSLMEAHQVRPQPILAEDVQQLYEGRGVRLLAAGAPRSARARTGPRSPRRWRLRLPRAGLYRPRCCSRPRFVTHPNGERVQPVGSAAHEPLPALLARERHE